MFKYDIDFWFYDLVENKRTALNLRGLSLNKYSSLNASRERLAKSTKYSITKKYFSKTKKFHLSKIHKLKLDSVTTVVMAISAFLNIFDRQL